MPQPRTLARRAIRTVAATFTPARVPGLVAHFAADAPLYQESTLATRAVADGDPVGGWFDGSDVSGYATQGTADSRPLLKLGIQNGMPVVRYDGVDDTLLAANAVARGGEETIFVAARNGGGANTTLIGDSAGAFWLRHLGSNVTRWSAGGFSNGTNQSGDTALWVASTFAVVMVKRSILANTIQIWVNGVLGSSTTYSSGNAAGRYAIGSNAAASFWDGDLGEMIAFNRELNPTEQSRVQRYLMKRWGM
jgi:hypothetical protein